MFDVAFYLLVAYVILAVLFWFILKRLRRKVFLFVLYWLIPVMPYAVVEAQTDFGLQNLRPAISAGLQQDGEHSRFKDCKVLSLTPWVASVYVVSECSPGLPDKPYNIGLTMDLAPSRQGWHEIGEPNGIWSDGGNADGNIFPPYPTSEAYRTAKR